jgi:Coenzyme PQQ synthesis protein D (PqqD)
LDDRKRCVETTGATGSIAPDTIVARSPTVLATEAKSRVWMMSVSQETCFALDDIGSEIWRLLKEPRKFSDLVGILAAKYDADRATIAADLSAMIEKMAAQDALRLSRR